MVLTSGLDASGELSPSGTKRERSCRAIGAARSPVGPDSGTFCRSTRMGAAIARGWIVATHPARGLPLVALYDARGTQLGWLIGYAFDKDQGSLIDRATIPCAASGTDETANIEKWLFELAGSFVIAFVHLRAPRVYVDAAASLSAVYSIRDPIVASSVNLIPCKSDQGDKELQGVLDIPTCDNWYPFGLTPRFDVERLLPSHFLDLEKWVAVRNWPRRQPVILGDAGVADVVNAIASRVEQSMSSFAHASPLNMNLTAGRDSRMILACARSVVDRITFATTRLPSRTGSIDCEIAAALAKRHGLAHPVSEWVEASPEEVNEWLFRTGTCVAGMTSRFSSVARRWGRPDAATIVGTGGEVGRSFYWRTATPRQRTFRVTLWLHV